MNELRVVPPLTQHLRREPPLLTWTLRRLTHPTIQSLISSHSLLHLTHFISSAFTSLNSFYAPLPLTQFISPTPSPHSFHLIRLHLTHFILSTPSPDSIHLIHPFTSLISSHPLLHLTHCITSTFCPNNISIVVHTIITDVDYFHLPAMIIFKSYWCRNHLSS